MFLTLDQLKKGLVALDVAKRTFHCDVARVDETGAEGFTVGDVTVPYGKHDADFLQVDPSTGQVRCGACAGEMSACAQKKQEIQIGKRLHRVSVDTGGQR